MNGTDMPAWGAVLVALLLAGGGTIGLIGSLGVLRLPLFFQRLHASALITTLATFCVLAASMLAFTLSSGRPVLHEILISLFVLLTAPMSSMLLARAALYRTGHLPGHERP